MKTLKLRLNPRPNAKVPPLNYRHHFHAGNFADLMKHALWLKLLARLVADPAPLSVVDTHAGAGLYDLHDPMAQRSREAEAGIARLMADPAAPSVFSDLKDAVLAENPDGVLRRYPGSPLLTVSMLRSKDNFTACERRPDDAAALQALLEGRRKSPMTQVVLADGYAHLVARSPKPRSKPVYLIDAPFERSDEYDQIIAAVKRTLYSRGDAIFAIWAPLKDLETFDSLLRKLKLLTPSPMLAAEVKLRPLRDPMKMNGSAMILINAPDLEGEATAICEWVARRCGDADGGARVRKLRR